MNYRMIFYTLGWILLFEAGFLAVPALTAIVYSEQILLQFLLSMAICLGVSALLLLQKPRHTTLRSRDGFIIAALSWIVLSLFGALPLFLSGVTPNYVDALFETVSGFTTTGATIFTNVNILPRSILMWRSFTHWVGGMGVLVFLMVFLPLSGGQNMHIMKAESTGPAVGKLVPRVRSTALLLYSIYFALTAAQFVLLLLGKMSVFDALNTAFSTAGTGGFSVRNDGMSSFSPYIQVVISIFMLLFSLNFGSYFLILRRQYKEALTTEVRTFLLIVVTAVIVITVNISGMFDRAGDALRHALFTVSSIISTTGFATVDFDLWPELSRGILVLLMFIGACAGSTGGGIKVSRLIILFKGMARELRAAVHPKEVRKITVDGKPVGTEVVRSVYGYIVCFSLIFVFSMLLISIDNHDFTTNFTAVAATINNIGPGLSAVGPTQNFAFFSNLSKLVMIFDMLVGRLEIFPIMLLFTPATWKK